MVVELLWCWLGIGKGISNPNLWREQWDPTQPQVPSGLEPENFPLLNRTTSPRARKSFPWVRTFFPLSLKIRREKHWGGMCTGFILWKEKEKWREILVLVRRERREVCGTTSPIPNMLLLLASPQRFNSAVLGTVQYLQFPLTLAGHGFTLTPFSLFLFRLHFILCYMKKSDGTFLHPR